MQGNKYYTCTTESVLENGATVDNTWRVSTPNEADNYFTGNGTAGQVKRGDMDTTRIYVYEGRWRRGTSLDWALGQGCLASKVGTILKVSNKYYTCTAEAVEYTDDIVNNTWRLSKAFEADTYGWSNPSSKADSVKRGNVDPSHYYVFENSAWRLGTSLDSDEGLGPCLTKKLNQLGQIKNVTGAAGQYICVSDVVIIDGVRVPTSWRKATNYEMDTYPLSSTTATGTYSAGKVNTNLHYVKEATYWRPATDLENAGLKACTNVQKDSVKVTSAGTKDSWYKCTNEVGTTVDGYKAPYTWRKATDIEKDTVGWGKSSYSTGDVKYGKINTNLVYVRQNATWRHGTSLDMLLKNAGGKACITNYDTSTVKYDNVYYVCTPQSTPDTVRKWVEAPAIYNDTKEARTECKENGLYGDGTILVGRVNTERMYVCDNGQFRPALSDEISYNRACVSYIKDLYIYRVNGVFRKCTNSGWVRAEDRSVGRVKDAAGKVYTTTVAGTQQWMRENLNYNISGSYCYGNNADSCAKYGRLYTWQAAKTACPVGWHLPTQSEYFTLLDEARTGTTFQGLEGYALKAQSGWTRAGADAVYFSAIPAGYRSGGGSYLNKTDMAVFWTSTGNASKNIAASLTLQDTSYLAKSPADSIARAYSVRCIQD